MPRSSADAPNSLSSALALPIGQSLISHGLLRRHRRLFELRKCARCRDYPTYPATDRCHGEKNGGDRGPSVGRLPFPCRGFPYPGRQFAAASRRTHCHITSYTGEWSSPPCCFSATVAWSSACDYDAERRRSGVRVQLRRRLCHSSARRKGKSPPAAAHGRRWPRARIGCESN